jgi:hypothetical protein
MSPDKVVIPAKAGTQAIHAADADKKGLGSRLRGNDEA